MILLAAAPSSGPVPGMKGTSLMPPRPLCVASRIRTGRTVTSFESGPIGDDPVRDHVSRWATLRLHGVPESISPMPLRAYPACFPATGATRPLRSAFQSIRLPPCPSETLEEAFSRQEVSFSFDPPIFDGISAVH